MCNPIAVGAVMAVAAVASKTAEISSTNAAAKRSAESAANSANLSYEALRGQAVQTNTKAQLESFERQRQAIREQSKLLVAAGESGVLGGVSPARAIIDSAMQGSIDVGLINENRENALDQIELKNKQVYAEADTRIKAAKASAVSPFMSFLKIGYAGAQGFASGYMMGNGLSSLGSGSSLSNAEWAHANSFGGGTGGSPSPTEFFRT